MTSVGVRAVTVGGWSAAAALLAHGGPALLADPRWLALAISGSLLAACGLSITAGRAIDRQARLRRIASGRLPPAGTTVFTRAPLSALLGAMLLCQGAAHAALVAGGVHAAAGTGGTLALHAALAAVGALMVFGLESVLERLTASLADAVKRVLELLTAVVGVTSPPVESSPTAWHAPVTICLRGPPAAHRS
jgi:hypothetical protein